MISLVDLPEDMHLSAIKRVYDELRDWNRIEMAVAFPGSENPVADAFLFHVNTPAIRRFVFKSYDQDPIGLAGCIPLAEDSGQLYFIGTPEVEEFGVRIAAAIRRFLPDAAQHYGIRTLWCRALQGNPKTPRWFRALGGVLARSEQDQFGNLFDIYEWSFNDVSR